MVEYETANPGQDASIPEGEHFDPNASQHVSFMPKDDASAMEEGRAGTPVEYGTEMRPYSKSSAPPHPNDQYAGLETGMHEHEKVPPNTAGGLSPPDQTYPNGHPPLRHQVARKPAMKPVSQDSMSPGGKERSVRHNTTHNRNARGSMAGAMGSKRFDDDSVSD